MSNIIIIFVQNLKLITMLRELDNFYLKQLIDQLNKRINQLESEIESINKSVITLNSKHRIYGK